MQQPVCPARPGVGSSWLEERELKSLLTEPSGCPLWAPSIVPGAHAPAAAAVPGAPPVAFGGQDSDDSERGGDDDFNDNCGVPASEDAEMMGWDTYDDDYVGS